MGNVEYKRILEDEGSYIYPDNVITIRKDIFNRKKKKNFKKVPRV